MIIGDFDIVGVTVFPYKADSVLLVDSNRMLAPTSTVQSVQIESRSHTQIVKRWNGGKERETPPAEIVQVARETAPGRFGIDPCGNVPRSAIAIGPNRHLSYFSV
jgi:hypothetical protein